MPPEHSTEIFMGSQFVLTGGKPTAKIPYSLAMTCCNPVNLPSAMASVPIATRLVIIGGGIIVDFLAMFANMATSLLGFRFFSAYGNWFMNLGGPFATEAMRRVAQQFVQLVTVDAAKAVVDGTKSMAEGNGFWLGFGNSYAQSAVNRVIGAVNPVPGAGGDAINGVVSNLAQEGVDNAITGS
jgi:hypothetical protein